MLSAGEPGIIRHRSPAILGGLRSDYRLRRANLPSIEPKHATVFKIRPPFASMAADNLFLTKNRPYKGQPLVPQKLHQEVRINQ